MNLPRQPQTIADYLGIGIDAIRKRMHNMGLVDGRFDRTAQLPEAEVVAILEEYAQNGRGLSRTKAAELIPIPDQANGLKTNPSAKTDEAQADESPQTDQRTTDLPRENEQAKRTKPLRRTKQTDEALSIPAASSAGNGTTPWMEIGKDGLLSLIALVSMYVQMVHTSVVVAGSGALSLHAWAYAISIQFTGLAMTLYKGNLWYLRVFALAEFAINLLYYRPWTIGGPEEWTRSILLSALIAFTIYSYVEIFAARRTNQNGTSYE